MIMKTILTALLLFLTLHLLSQGLPQSTIRQVYDLHTGDTLEYISDHINAIGNQEVRSYIIRTIQSRQDMGDSIILQMTDKMTSSIVYSQGPSWGDTFTNRFIYTNLDSTIFSYHSHSLGCDTNHVCYIDTAYRDSTQLNLRKIDHHWEGNRIAFAYDTSYADGLGLISGSFGSEDNLALQGGFNIAYYHLANGETWGTPYYFRLPNGINDYNAISPSVSIYPNPAFSSFEIKLDAALPSPTTFYLYDETGRLVKQQQILNPKSSIKRDALSNGIYFWSLHTDGYELQHGKLVFE
jgi:hypothetical protein